MLKLFTGFDAREAEGWLVFVRSLVLHSPIPVQVIPLTGLQHDGTNTFTYERFKIPELCDWQGMAIWADGSDMLLRADIHELAKLYDPSKAVQVVKHDYRTKHPRKYVGTAMEAPNADYERKNWSSLVIFNAGHIAHFEAMDAIRKAVEEGDGKFLHRFGWLKDEEIGELPPTWNWLADEYGENLEAKLLHWTAGYPGFNHYRDAPMAPFWHATARTLHSER